MNKHEAIQYQEDLHQRILANRGGISDTELLESIVKMLVIHSQLIHRIHILGLAYDGLPWASIAHCIMIYKLRHNSKFDMGDLMIVNEE